ncbi:autotransporter-associated beta strand repeat-containing protein [Limisphaera sp. VF-2]|uniref:autotransporter-associated beta strand repeat-containing protein n=1 Tax=Limisphaera sp. VF-2 TaxID=3400418 RepID=UPI003C1ABBD4
MKTSLLLRIFWGCLSLPATLWSATNEFRWDPGTGGFLWHSADNWIGATGIPDDETDRARFDTLPADNSPLLDQDVAGNLGGGLGRLEFDTAGWWIRNTPGTSNTLYFNSGRYFSGVAIVSRGVGLNLLDVWVHFLEPQQAIMTASGSTVVLARGLRGGYAPVIDSLDPTASDTGTVRLDAPSTMVSGSFYLRQGTLLVRHSNALTGSSLDVGGDASVVDGAWARLLTDAAGVEIGQNITVRSYPGHEVRAVLGGHQSTGSSSFTGIITLHRDARLVSANTDSSAVSFNNVITGPGGIIKTGPGAVALNAANAYGGPTIVGEGTLLLGAAGALPSGTTLVLSNAPGTALQLNQYSQTVDSLWGGGPAGGTVILGAATFTVGGGDFAGVIAGSGSLIKTGPGTLLLRGVNTYTGLTTVQEGVLRLGVANAIASSAGVSLGNTPGVYLDLNDNDQTLNGLSGGGAAGGHVLLGTANLTVGLGDFAGVITGTGGLTKTSPGTLVLRGQNLYSGPTRLEGGVLRLGATNALPPGTTVELGEVLGTTLDLDGFPQAIGSLAGGGTIALGTATLTVGGGDFSGVITGAGGLAKTGPGVLTLRGANQYTGPTLIHDGVVQLGTVNALPPGTSVVLANQPGAALDLQSFNQTLASLSGGGADGGFVWLGSGTLTVGGGNFAGAVVGTGGLTKVGPGTLVLAGKNTFTGPTTILEGTLRYATDDALASEALVLQGPSAVLDLGGFSETVGSVTLAGGARIEGDGRLHGTNRFEFWSGTVRATLGGPADLLKSTEGTVTLAASNTFTGDTRLLGGTLWVQHARALQNSTLEMKAGDKGTLDVDLSPGQTLVLGGLKGERDLMLRGPIGLAVGANDTSTEYSGRILGAGITLSKVGSGTWTLTGDHTFEGVTLVRQGTLQIGNGRTSGWIATPVTVEAEATIAFNRADDVRFDFPIQGGGGLVQQGPGVLVLASTENAYQGPTRVEQGSLLIEGHNQGGGEYRVGGFGQPARLGGTGILEGTVFVESDSVLSPGLSLGTLTIWGDVALSGTLRIEVDGTGSGFTDLLTVLGSLTLGPTATLEIQEWRPVDDEAYIFASYESLWGRFVDVRGLPPGYMIDYNYHGARQIALVVPEPSIVALIGVGALAWRLRRNKTLPHIPRA